MNYDPEDDSRAMLPWGPRLRDDVRISEPDSRSLAIAIFEDVRNLPDNVKAELRSSDEVTFDERLNELNLFTNYLEQSQNCGNQSPLEERAGLVLSNYLCFVYLGDACFTRLKRVVPSGSVSHKCCKFLTDNPVRAFRNAIAHANWRVAPEGQIVFWARKGDSKDDPLVEFRVGHSERSFWFFLSLCVARAVYAALTSGPA